MRPSNYCQVLDHSYLPPSTEWLIDGMLASSGMTGVHGAPRSGRTSLVIQLVEAARSGKPVLGRSVPGTATRVAVFATNAWAAKRYYDRLRSDDSVVVVNWSVPSVSEPEPWSGARDIAESFGASLVVIDSMPQCQPEQVPAAKAEVDAFGTPVLAVFAGAASTQSIRPDDWRSEFTAGIHLLGGKGVTSALNLYSQFATATELPVSFVHTLDRFGQLDAFGNVIAVAAPAITAEMVAQLGEVARVNRINVTGSSRTIGQALLGEGYNAVLDICGYEPKSADLAAAIDTYIADWHSGLRPTRPQSSLAVEPPF